MLGVRGVALTREKVREEEKEGDDRWARVVGEKKKKRERGGGLSAGLDWGDGEMGQGKR